MDKNIVIVKVGNSSGTGVIFNTNDKCSTIIITCAHCISNANENKDIKIEFCKNEYKVKDYFFDRTTDIAAVLIEEKIEVENLYIDYNFKAINKSLNIKGYPQIVERKDSKCLDCHLREIKNYEDEYKITLKLDEKINDTSSSTEKEKLEGFSGSPVFYKKNKKIFVVGLLNEIEGDNKNEDTIYNDVKAIKIKTIFDELYKKNIILYYIEPDKSIKIKWIKNYYFDDKYYKEKKILILGGSGAGKSSFIKTFLMNNELLDSSGDGQTTRNNIEYSISINNKEPKIECNLLTKNEFVEKRIEQIEIDLLEYYFYILLKERYDLHSEIDLPIKNRLLKKILRNNEDILKDEILNEWCKIISEVDIESKKNELINLNYKYISNIIKELTINKLEKEQKKELKDILLKCRGFFNYEEFDFLENEKKSNSKVIEEIFEETFENATIINLKNIKNKEESSNEKKNDNENLIEKFFEKVYDKIEPQILEYFNISKLESNKKPKFSFNPLDKEFQDKISYLLKVKNGHSITSMIKSIKIEDGFNNRYAWIMEELKLKKIILIDTCGLDHVERGEAPIEVIKKAFSEQQDDIKTVIYVKKLDSGRPTELEQIIPTIYKVQSNAVVYCVLNGADILYSNHKKSDIIDLEDKEKRPNSVKYLLSEEGEKDITNSIKKKTCKNGRYIRKRRSEILYKVLTKNLVLYSSKKINNNFFINNEFYIKKLFKSIVKEEHLEGEILPDSIIEYIQSNKFENRLEKVLYELFKDASITDWGRSTIGHGNHNVKMANIKRIFGGILGFYGKYDDRWNQHFKESYQNIFAMSSEEDKIQKDKIQEDNIKEDNIQKLFKKYTENYYDKLESILIDFKDEFFGCSCDNTIKIFPTENLICSECEEECFRKILLSAYTEEEWKQLKYIINEEVYECFHEQLNKICNFKEKFERNQVKGRFVDYFKKKLEDKIKIDKSESLNRILRINPDIERDFNLLKEKIGKCFWGSDKLDDKLLDMIIEKLRKK